jgi:hypothetical protein
MGLHLSEIRARGTQVPGEAASAALRGALWALSPQHIASQSEWLAQRRLCSDRSIAPCKNRRCALSRARLFLDVVTNTLSDKVSGSVADRVADASADGIPDVVPDRVSDPVADRVSVASIDWIPDVVTNRVASAFADRAPTPGPTGSPSSSPTQSPTSAKRVAHSVQTRRTLSQTSRQPQPRSCALRPRLRCRPAFASALQSKSLPFSVQP